MSSLLAKVHDESLKQQWHKGNIKKKGEKKDWAFAIMESEEGRWYKNKGSPLSMACSWLSAVNEKHN
jgi:hypothetical protein